MGEWSATSSTSPVGALDSDFASRTGPADIGRWRPTGAVFLAALLVGQLAPLSEQKLETYSGVAHPRPLNATVSGTWSSTLSGTFAYAKLYEPQPADTAIREIVPVRVSTIDPADELRRLTGLPVSELAALVGVSRVAYHDWLKGRPIALQRERALLQILSVVREASRNRDRDALRRWIMQPLTGTRSSPFSLLSGGKWEEALGLALLPEKQIPAIERSTLDESIETLIGVPFNRAPRVGSRGFTERIGHPALVQERNLHRGWRDLPPPEVSPDRATLYTEHEI